MRDCPLAPTRVDYLLAVMGALLVGGLLLGALSTVPLRVAAGGGSLFAGCLMAVGLVRYPRSASSRPGR